MSEVFYAVRGSEIFVVPNFISEGYFCQEVIPRELGLNGPTTLRNGARVHYCDPVGVHPSMTKLLLKRAAEVAPGIAPEETALVIVGHGTSLNENSTKAIKDQVKLIREGGHGFAEVVDAYMEEAPFVAKWDELTTAPHVVVVPFFIADGLHSYQDIPVLLGITDEPTAAASQNEVFWHNPHTLRGRKLYYSSAIGTEALMADVILDQVTDFKKRHGIADAPDSVPRPGSSETHPAVEAMLTRQEGFRIGQIRAKKQDAGVWHCHHIDDEVERGGLQTFTAPEDARTIATYDDAGAFRPAKSAPTLRHGWLLRLSTTAELLLALDFFYPAAVGIWEHWLSRTLQPVSLRETLGRQTGMYRFANTVTDEQALQMVADETDARTKCLRQILWPLSKEQPLTGLAADKMPPDPQATDGEIPLLSVEAGPLLVNAAREAARAARLSKTAAETSATTGH